jgi:hypothetical protein
MLWDVGYRDTVDITMRFLTEVSFVGNLRVFVPITGKNTCAPRPFESNAKPPDSAEEINETKFGCCGHATDVVWRCFLAQYLAGGLLASDLVWSVFLRYQGHASIILLVLFSFFTRHDDSSHLKITDKNQAGQVGGSIQKPP